MFRCVLCYLSECCIARLLWSGNWEHPSGAHFHSPAIIGNRALCGGGSGLCIGKLYRTKLFEGVEGDGSVEGWILPSWCSDVVGTGESAGVILQSLHL